MKKALLFAIAIVSISFTSCKKDWTCTCTDNVTGESYDMPISNARKPEASTACTLFELSGEDCKLK